MAGYDDDLRFAHVLADAADDITMRRFRALDLRVETKPDLTPVSDADKRGRGDRCAACCAGPGRGTPCSARSSAGAARGPRCWVIDPIDGTKNYVRGVPVWATLIALMEGDRGGGRAWCPRPLSAGAGGPRCAAAPGPARPDQGDPVPGVRGGPDRRRLAFLLQPGRMGGARQAHGFLGLTQSVWRTRAFGDFWSHVLVAEGAVDVVGRARSAPVGHRRAADHRGGGGRACSPTWTGTPGRTGAAWCVPTRGCTRRYSTAWLAQEPDRMCLFAWPDRPGIRPCPRAGLRGCWGK